MQTAIHFEGDQAYICVSDHGKIKEEEPVSYGRSRVEFVIQTAKAQEEGKIAVVFDDATGKIVKDAEEQCIRSGLQQGQVNFFTKEEAALGVVLFRGSKRLHITDQTCCYRPGKRCSIFNDHQTGIGQRNYNDDLFMWRRI